MMKKTLAAGLAALIAAGCAEEAAEQPSEVAKAETPVVAEEPVAGFSEEEITAAAAQIDAEEFAEHIRVLASDEFAGRAPATEGETKTIDYLVQQFEAIGAEPGNGDSYLQAVKLVEITAQGDPAMVISAEGESRELKSREDVVAWTKRVTEHAELKDSPLVFVGYGIVAPEYDWNDYEGLDVAGKTVVMLVNDPGYATQDANLFNGNAMTYYGRWTYKYEEAARQGAAGALVIHDTGPAGYGWNVVTGSWTGAQLDLVNESGNADRVAVEGWLSQEAAQELFAAAGHDLAALSQAAAKPGFEPVALDQMASIEIHNAIRYSDSYNVVARIPGSERPDEHFVYMAHWDHMGTMAGDEGDLIYNGAKDNATGTAALLEIAQAYKALPRPPERSVILLAVTAEESGLLGSKHYAENPIYPLAQMVGGVNMDSMNVFGETNDIEVIGFGSSQLEDILAREAEAQAREVVAEPQPEKGYFYRSDHFNFAKKGVPVLYAKGGLNLRNGGVEAGDAAESDYRANRYHQPGDEFDPNWDLGGAIQDMQLYFRVGLAVADSAAWPEWYEGNEFKAARQAQRAGQ